MFEITKLGRARKRFYVAFATVSVVGGLLLTTSGVLAQPSNFMDIANHQPRYSGTGTYDWANGAASPADCSHPATGTQTCP
jgi:hypothetical protein